MADPSNDEISLDGLLGDDIIASDTPAAASSESTAPLSPPPATYGKNSDVDGLLASEDPNFAASLAELKAQGGLAAGEAEIDTLDLDQLKKEKMPGRIRLFFEWLTAPLMNWVIAPIYVRLNARMGEGHTIKSRVKQLPSLLVAGAKWLAHFLKERTVQFFAWLKARTHDFVELPRKSKILLGLALAFGALAVVTFQISMKQRLNTGFGKIFFRSFADVADARFEYGKDEPMEDFADPLFHPEHMMLLDKFVVNLRQPRDGSVNPMGLFEFYLEASNQDSAVEIKDRQAEIRDVISRTLEQIGYNDLITIEGKEKMKVVLRKNVNEVLTRGQVRRVFIKTIVLKP